LKQIEKFWPKGMQSIARELITSKEEGEEKSKFKESKVPPMN